VTHPKKVKENFRLWTLSGRFISSHSQRKKITGDVKLGEVKRVKRWAVNSSVVI